MKPLDPKLLQFAAPARRYVIFTAALGALTAALIVVQAILLAKVLGPVIGHTADFAEVKPLLGLLTVVFAARVTVSWAQERWGQRAGTQVVVDLREKVISHATALGPRWLDDGRAPGIVTLVTRGLDDLQPYLTRYLPQLLLAATVTPAALIVVWTQDWVSALIALVTLPLVPLFMILIGRLTEGTSERRLVTMRRLGSQVLDLIAGIPTLRAFGRERGPVQRVQKLGDAYRRSTMGALRVAFLSGFALELLTTLSVAMIAVGIGLRLVEGQFDLTTGLLVLILAPEIYLPIRQVGMHFHASADGLAAASSAFKVLETPLVKPGDGADVVAVAAPDLRGGTLTLNGISVLTSEGERLAPSNLTAEFRSGEITAIVGPNGAGKSTAILVLLGLIQPDDGTSYLQAGAGDGAVSVAEVDRQSLWSQVSWLPQRPWLAPGTILSNVLDGSAQVIPPHVLQAAQMTGLDLVVAGLDDGWNTVVGNLGVGLSVGQRQKVAMTKALLSDAPVVIFDEPTAHLDQASSEAVHAALTQLRDEGRIVIVVAHRPELAGLCDAVVHVESTPVIESVNADSNPDTGVLHA